MGLRIDKLMNEGTLILLNSCNMSMSWFCDTSSLIEALKECGYEDELSDGNKEYIIEQLYANLENFSPDNFEEEIELLKKEFKC